MGCKSVQFLFFGFAPRRARDYHCSLDRCTGFFALQIGFGKCGVYYSAGRALGIGSELREAGHLIGATNAACVEDFGPVAQVVADTDEQVRVCEAHDLAAASACRDGLGRSGSDHCDRLECCSVERERVVVVLQKYRTLKRGPQ